MSEVMKVYANFHTHTTHSDGVFTPREMANMAADEGYRALSITDHDTFTGNAEAAEACRELGLGFMPGIVFFRYITSFRGHLHPTAADRSSEQHGWCQPASDGQRQHLLPHP